MQNRRDFLKTAAFAAIGSGLSLQGVFAGEKSPASLRSTNSAWEQS